MTQRQPTIADGDDTRSESQANPYSTAAVYRNLYRNNEYIIEERLLIRREKRARSHS